MQRLEIIDNMLKKAENFILKVRSQEGGWGRSTSHFLNVWLTAYVIKTLAANNELCTLLTPSLSWLCSQLNKSYKWEQKSIDNLYSDGTALALLASNSLDWHTQKVRKQDLLLNLLRKKECSSNEKIYGTQEQDYEPLEITSLILLAKMRLGFERSELINGLENILCQQRTDGGWNSLWGKDVMFATYRVLDTLDAFAKTQNPKYCSDADRRMVYSYEKAVNSSLCFILDHTTASEPFALGLWLTSWFVAKGNKDFPSVDRILFKLSKQQQEDGRFCSTLIEPTGKTKLSWPVFLEHFELDVDRDLAVTTMVYNGLRETQKALRNNR